MFVTDLGSTNGTYIDSRKIKPRTVTPVSHGSCITFGNVGILLHFEIQTVCFGLQFMSPGSLWRVRYFNVVMYEMLQTILLH